MEHPPNLDAFSHKRFDIALWYRSEVAGQDQVILQLTAGVERDTQEARKLFFAFLASTFDNICRDGNCGSNYLAAQ
jgi:hypothetical protein